MSDITNSLFKISLVDWESGSELLFIGPTTASEIDFHKAVDASVEEAVEEALLETLKEDRFLEFYEIVHKAIPYLKKRGFEFVQGVKTVSYREGIISHIPLPGDMNSSAVVDINAITALGRWAQKVADYNDKMLTH